MNKIKSVKVLEFYGENQLSAIMEDGTEEYLFRYLPTEYHINTDMLIGLTVDQAHGFKRYKDQQYLEANIE